MANDITAGGISVAPGTFAGGTRMMDIAMPIIAQSLQGMFAGKKDLEETTRKRSLEDLATLVQLHGADAVNQPQFNDLYKSIFGKDWPTEDVEIPAVTEKTTTQEQIGTRVMPRTSPDEALTPYERQRRGEQMFGSEAPYGYKAYPVYGGVEKEVEVKPAQTIKRPAPFGGMQKDPTLGEMGLPVPQGFGNLRVSQAKALGLDLDKLIFADTNRDKVEGALLAKFASGQQMNQQEMAIVAHLVSKDPTTFDSFVIQEIYKAQGDISKLPPYLQQYVQNKVEGENRNNTVEQIRAKVAKGGIGGLTDGEFQIYMDEIAKPADRGKKQTIEDMKVQYVKDPAFRSYIDADPALRSLVLGTGGQIMNLKDAQMKLMSAEAALAQTRGTLLSIRSELIMRGRHGAAEHMKDPRFKEAHAKFQAALLARDAWAAQVKELQATPSQTPGRVVFTLPAANSVLPGTVVRDADTGTPLYRSDGKQWLDINTGQPIK